MKMLQVNFIMIYIINKILGLKITRILKRFLRSIIDFYFLKNKYFFFATYNDKKYKASTGKQNSRWKKSVQIEKTKKETTDTTIKNIRNIFRLEKRTKKLKTE